MQRVHSTLCIIPYAMCPQYGALLSDLMPLTTHSVLGDTKIHLLALVEVLRRGTLDHQLVTSPFHQIL